MKQCIKEFDNPVDKKPPCNNANYKNKDNNADKDNNLACIEYELFLCEK